MDKIGLAYRLDAIAGMWPILGKDARAAIRQAAAALRESEELRRDSERYRWLRTNPPNARVWFEHDDGFGADSFEGDDFDAAIDSARWVER